MKTEHLALAKKILVAYWLSVFVCALLFIDSSFAQKYILFGGLIFLAHVIETFLFDKVLQAHSDNVFRDKLLMLPFGFVIPAELKLKAKQNDQ